MPTSDTPEGTESRNRSGGGIVYGGGTRSPAKACGSIADLIAGLRRRWASGIALVTARDAEGGLRGVTVTSLMIVSQEPPVVAIALAASGTFQRLAVVDALLGLSVLESGHEFAAERFAGRAPVPDARLTGVPHWIEDGVPVLDGALAWCVGRVMSKEDVGDHVLVLLEAGRGALGPDTDDPLISYEGRYRRLEAG